MLSFMGGIMMKKTFALLLVLVALFSFVSCGNGGGGAEEGYKKAVELLAEVEYGGATDKLESLAPELFWDYYEKTYAMPRKSMLDEVAWAVEQTNTQLEELYGADFGMAVEITQATEADAELLSKIGAAFAEQKGIEAEKIKGAYTLKAKVTFNGSSTGEEELDLQVVKIEDTWYCAEWYFYDEGGYVVFTVETFVMG